MSKRTKEVIRFVLCVFAFILFLAGTGFLIINDEKNDQRQYEFETVCLDRGGRVYASEEDKCIIVQSDGKLAVIVTRPQFEAELEGVQ